jgi:hypothetical protein
MQDLRFHDDVSSDIGLWVLVVFWLYTNVSEDHAASIFGVGVRRGWEVDESIHQPRTFSKTTMKYLVVF